VARGGATSHAAILARALGIPSVVGLGEAIMGVDDGAMLIVDGDAGTVQVAPSDEELAARRRDREEADARAAEARERARQPARLRDGETIEVAANVGSVAEARAAVELGADGVGLLRTEFLFLDRDEAPSEDEQRAVYAEIAEALQGRPVIIRTLDAGADKPLPFLKQPPEDNPFLGVRGIRLGLANPELLETQLRAIAAVAKEHPVKVMFPMVATLDEYRQARAMLAADVEVGVMLEVPAVALQADAFAREVGFFSVGTNDLTQYTMAAERGNEALAPLLAGAQAPVLRLIRAAVEAADQHGRWVGVCGELAGDPEAAVILAGLGVRELSMAAGRIPAVKDALRAVSPDEARGAAEAALAS
jgi:phosphoenolpyruvate-protein phosphotransferase